MFPVLRRWYPSPVQVETVMRGAIGPLIVALLVSVGYGLAAESFVYRRTLVNPTPQEGDQFGLAVARVGGRIAVSAPSHDNGGSGGRGIVHMFDSSTGALLFSAPNPGSGPFGRQLAAAGPNLVVSAALGGGPVHLFDGETGALLQTFEDPTPGDGGWFGWSVGSLGSDVLVAEPNPTPDQPDLGAVYLFSGDTGALITTFTNPSPDAFDAFGFSAVGIEPYVAVGALYDDTAGPDAGAVYVFDPATGQLVDTMLNTDPSVLGFANVVDADAKLLVTAPYNGVTFVFDGTTRQLLLELRGPSGGYYGWAAVQVGDKIVVGAPGETVSSATGAFAFAGAVYVHSISDGSLVARLESPQPGESDYFGYSLAAFGDQIVIGAVRDSAAGMGAVGSATAALTTRARTNAVYIFAPGEAPPPPPPPPPPTDHLQDAVRLLLKQSRSGERLVWTSKMPGLALPTADPRLVGGTLRVTNPLTGEFATSPLHPGGWSRDASGNSFSFLHKVAPDGLSSVRSARLKRGGGLKLVAKRTLLTLDEASQRSVGIVLTIGDDRYCAECTLPRRDEPGRYVGQQCAPAATCR